MSFDVNFNKPVIKEAQSMQNDGGGGNLGYFENEGGEGEKHKKQASVFPETDGSLSDSFIKEGEIQEDDAEDFSFARLIAQIILAFKDFFAKIFRK